MKNFKLIHGDALLELKKLSSNSFDLILSDPPYNSGGNTLSAVQIAPSKKYLEKEKDVRKRDAYAEIMGDQQSLFSFQEWYLAWLNEAYRVMKSGGTLLLFCDWRSLPAVSSWGQWANFLYKGIVVWNKKSARPLMYRFKHQAEYVTFFTKDKFEPNKNAGALPGVFEYAAPSPKNKKAMTEKPVDLLVDLLQICKPGSKVLDPFMGSGSTLEACLRCDLDCVGIEKSLDYYLIAQERIGKFFEQE